MEERLDIFQIASEKSGVKDRKSGKRGLQP
jgi:hypothetical protein